LRRGINLPSEEFNNMAAAGKNDFTVYPRSRPN